MNALHGPHSVDGCFSTVFCRVSSTLPMHNKKSNWELLHCECDHFHPSTAPTHTIVLNTTATDFGLVNCVANYGKFVTKIWPMKARFVSGRDHILNDTIETRITDISLNLYELSRQPWCLDGGSTTTTTTTPKSRLPSLCFRVWWHCATAAAIGCWPWQSISIADSILQYH